MSIKSFTAANKWLKGRVNVPTALGSKELALSPNFPAQVRAHCFFSARVEEAGIVDGLRRLSDSFSRGEINQATARMRMKLFLSRSGFGYVADDVADPAAGPPEGVDPEDWKAAKSMGNLGSSARLNLILRQNAAMANAVGQREVSMEPAILERWPYLRYLPSTSQNKNPAHKKFYNLVLPKTDPFWIRWTPPNDFGCHCGVEDCDAEEAKEFGGVSKAVATKDGFKLDIAGKYASAVPPESGYVFDVNEAFSACEMSRIQNIPMRKAVFARLRDYTRHNDAARFVCSPGGPMAPMGLRPRSGLRNAATYLQAQSAALEASGEFLDKDIRLGAFSPEMADALGLETSGQITLGKGGKSHGLTHMLKTHKKEIADGRFLKALQDTVFAKDVNPSVQLAGKKMFCNIDNPSTGAFATLLHFGQNDEWKIVSAHYPGQKYVTGKETLK